MATSQELIDELQKRVDVAYIHEHQANQRLGIALKTLEWINNFAEDVRVRDITYKALKDIRECN